jgi:hypothetical protein
LRACIAQKRRVDQRRSGSKISQDWRKIALAVLLLVLAASAGVVTGSWIAGRAPNSKDLGQLDENVGLAPRTGLTGVLKLAVDPITFQVESGKPIRLRLKLVNSGTQQLALNKWFTPVPAELHSNQFPFKVIVTRDGQPMHYYGALAIPPPHKQDDFLTLSPGQAMDLDMDIYQGANRRGWDMSVPGDYKVEVWYETYLTGKYVGVNAWTGMTNHVVAQVTVSPSGR